MRFWELGWAKRILGVVFVAAGFFHLLMRTVVAVPAAKSWSWPQWVMAIEFADAFIFVGVVFALALIAVRSAVTFMREDHSDGGNVVVAIVAGIAAYKVLENPVWFTPDGYPVIAILAGLGLGLWLFLSE